jgi:hypothetical protein
VTILDISFDKNRAGVVDALAKGCSVLYVDHHFAGEVPESPLLTKRIDEDPGINTALLVNAHLGGKQPLWAVVGAFGDNVAEPAKKLAKEAGLSDEETALLDRLGICMNYNGYGEDPGARVQTIVADFSCYSCLPGPAEEDLHFTPAELYRLAVAHPNPLTFAKSPAFEVLSKGYDEDMGKAASLQPFKATSAAACFMLPDEKWARRVSGVYSNDLATDNPSRAHAVISPNPSGGYLVSVRAPLDRLKTAPPAQELVRKFPTGGGRAAAAGINNLPENMLDDFVAAFLAHYALPEGTKM